MKHITETKCICSCTGESFFGDLCPSDVGG